MNTDTGRIYRNEEEIQAARARGESLVEISEAQADLADQIEAAPAFGWAHERQQVDPFGDRRHQAKRTRRRISERSRQRNRTRR